MSPGYAPCHPAAGLRGGEVGAYILPVLATGKEQQHGAGVISTQAYLRRGGRWEGVLPSPRGGRALSPDRALGSF